MPIDILIDVIRVQYECIIHIQYPMLPHTKYSNICPYTTKPSSSKTIVLLIRISIHEVNTSCQRGHLGA